VYETCLCYEFFIHMYDGLFCLLRTHHIRKILQQHWSMSMLEV
jgi:hypothetical protein